MTSTSQGIIYLAEQRGCTQTEWFRSHHTFNFGTYFREHRKPFGNIQIVNDETLKESFTLKHHVQEDSIMLLLPLVGVCHYKNNSNTLGIVDVGQFAVFFANKDLEFEIITVRGKSIFSKRFS